MSVVVPLIQPVIECEYCPIPCHGQQPYSFDMTQTDQRGMVLIDACVPAAMATAFLQLLIAFQEASAV